MCWLPVKQVTSCLYSSLALSGRYAFLLARSWGDWPSTDTSSACPFPTPSNALCIYRLRIGFVSEDVRTNFCDPLSLTRDACETVWSCPLEPHGLTATYASEYHNWSSGSMRPIYDWLMAAHLVQIQSRQPQLQWGLILKVMWDPTNSKSEVCNFQNSIMKEVWLL